MSDNNLFWNEAIGNPELSAAEQTLRNRFVDQYLLDYDPVAACVRIGYHKTFAIDYAKKFMEEPYVLRRIAEQQVEEPEDLKDEDVSTRRAIRAKLLKEASNYGPGSSHSARVNALSKLAAMYDMDAPKKIEASITNRGGVMEVPAIGSLSEWEQVAANQQKELSKAADV